MRQAFNESGTLIPAASFFDVAGRGAPEWRTKVDLLLAGETIHTAVEHVDGTVTVDRTAAHRSRANGITFPVPPGTVPIMSGGALAPVGWEIRVWCGIIARGFRTAALAGYLYDENWNPILTEDADGIIVEDAVRYGVDTVDETWWVPVFTGPIWTSRIDVNGVVTVDAWDRSKLLSRAKLADAVSMATTDTLEDKLQALLEGHPYGWIGEADWSGTSHAAPEVVHERGADPWATVTDHATAVGYELYFQGDGTLRWRPEPNVSSASPVRTVTETGELVGIEGTLDREPVVNAVQVIGANPEAGANIVAWADDTDVTSLTFTFGPFGVHREVYTDSLIASQADADASAAARLAANVGIGATLRYTTGPCPIVEPGDAELVQVEDMSVDRVVLIESQTISLAPGTQDHTARTRVTAEG